MSESETPTWCWSIYQSAVCLMGGDHAPNHAGSDLDGAWLRWTEPTSDAPGPYPSPAIPSDGA